MGYAADYHACGFRYKSPESMLDEGRLTERLLKNSAKKLLFKSMIQKKIVYLQNLLSMVLRLEVAAIQRKTTNYDI